MPVLLLITSGRGPAECCLVVAQLAENICADARRKGLYAEVIEEEPSPAKGTLLSALIHLDGDTAAQFSDGYVGTIQWIGASTFRPGHKRKNWFIGVQRLPLPETSPFSGSNIRIETMKGSGPGGQHVNTTESAVRATHTPTGLSAIARDERSQTANRKRALDRLGILLFRHAQREQARALKQRWDVHNELVRGNPVRVYQGPQFIQVQP